uniref:Disease resistance protein winged helix domain-containing protein n=1 Tax=Oryza nivara TaxID=4536 RepID=A0A0E0G4Q7_ORYNI
MEKSHLIQLVSQNSENHHIISIWGMIGIGKTFFIRSVYESEEITSIRVKNQSRLQRDDASLSLMISIEEWNLIQPHLPNETNTQIIVTTREASLKEDAALALFKNKLYSSNIDLDLDMTTQAKLIIKECDGHPLAITYIVGQNIRRKRIVRRWVAEGYISKTHSLSAEEVGESYFAELINRSIIQPSVPVPHNAGNIEYCRVHNLMHKISVSKSMEENHGFVLEVSSNNEGTVRHLSISNVGETNKNALKCVDLTHV